MCVFVSYFLHVYFSDLGDKKLFFGYLTCTGEVLQQRRFLVLVLSEILGVLLGMGACLMGSMREYAAGVGEVTDLACSTCNVCVSKWKKHVLVRNAHV